MVNKDELGIIFKALSDPLRRNIYQELSAASQPIQLKRIEACRTVSKPLLSKHVKYLLRSGLVVRHDKAGAHPSYSARRNPLEEAHWWIAEVMHFWPEEAS